MCDKSLKPANEWNQLHSNFLEGSCNNKIAYSVIGKGRPIIVLAGGPGGSSDLYVKSLQSLSDKNQVIFWDYRGCGKSSLADDYSYNRDLDDLHALIECLQLEKPVLFGHSYGGMVALLYALKRNKQNLLGGLVLSNTLSTTKIYPKIQEAQVGRLGELGCLEGWQSLLSKMQHDEMSERDIEEFQRMIFRTQVYEKDSVEKLLNLGADLNMEVNGVVNQTLSEYDIKALLPQVQIPTLVIAGKHDITAMDEPLIIHQLIKDSRYVLFDKSGHYPFIEEEQAYVDTIKKWLESE